jgi:excinuclease UvrABC nuclease subunit
MNVTELNPKVLDKIEFQLNKVKFVPSMIGCYVITNFHHEIMYIGQTVNLKTRIQQHLENPEKTKLTQIGRAYYFYYKTIEQEKDLNKLERGWLNEYELKEGHIPILNSVRGPI